MIFANDEETLEIRKLLLDALADSWEASLNTREKNIPIEFTLYTRTPYSTKMSKKLLVYPGRFFTEVYFSTREDMWQYSVVLGPTFSFVFFNCLKAIQDRLRIERVQSLTAKERSKGEDQER